MAEKSIHVMVETFQNMNKHSDEIRERNGSGLFIIGKKLDTYYVLPNMVARKYKDALEKSLITVNNATRRSLKEM